MDTTQNQYLDQLFDQIDATESPGGSYNKLLDGTHDLIISNFAVTQSKMGLGTILGIDFIVEKSPVHAPGDKRTWGFLPNKQGMAGKYEGERIKNFYSTVDASAGIAPRLSKETGAALLRGELRGVLVRAHVTPAYKDGVRIKNKKGQEVSNIEFSFLGQQSAADIAARAAKCPVAAPRQAPVQAQVPHAVAQPQYAPPQFAQPVPQAQPAYPQPQFAPPSGAVYGQQPVGYPPGMQPAQPAAPTGAIAPSPTGFLGDLNGGRR